MKATCFLLKGPVLKGIPKATHASQRTVPKISRILGTSNQLIRIAELEASRKRNGSRTESNTPLHVFWNVWLLFWTNNIQSSCWVSLECSLRLILGNPILSRILIMACAFCSYQQLQ